MVYSARMIQVIVFFSFFFFPSLSLSLPLPYISPSLVLPHSLILTRYAQANGLDHKPHSHTGRALVLNITKQNQRRTYVPCGKIGRGAPSEMARSEMVQR